MIAVLMAAVAANTFNLLCAGTLEVTTLEGTTNEPYSRIYRMDLDAKKWCEDDCKALHDFVDVGPTQLKLASENVDTISERRLYSSLINRETGVQNVLHTSGRRANIMIMKWTGRCEKQAFTGFPKFDTKF
jgi:hypothetical protein